MVVASTALYNQFVINVLLSGQRDLAGVRSQYERQPWTFRLLRSLPTQLASNLYRQIFPDVSTIPSDPVTMASHLYYWRVFSAPDVLTRDDECAWHAAEKSAHPILPFKVFRPCSHEPLVRVRAVNVHYGWRMPSATWEDVKRHWYDEVERAASGSHADRDVLDDAKGFYNIHNGHRVPGVREAMTALGLVAHDMDYTDASSRSNTVLFMSLTGGNASAALPMHHDGTHLNCARVKFDGGTLQCGIRCGRGKLIPFPMFSRGFAVVMDWQ